VAIAETARMLAELGFDGRKYDAGVKKSMGLTDKLDKGIGRVGKGTGQLSAGLAKAGTRIAAGVGLAFTGAAKAAIDWEDAFTGVRKTVNASEPEFANIAKGIRDLATTMPTTAGELAAIAEAGGAMGIKSEGILEFTKQVAILGSTTDVAVEDAAMALGQLGTILNLQTDEFDNFSAALVALGNEGTTTESKILEILNRAGSAAALFGLAKDETVGWSAAIANLGLGAELSGTAFQKILVQALPKFIEGSKTLQTVTGKTAKELKKSYEKDAGGALQSLIADLAKLDKGARLTAVQDLFGKGSGITQVVLGLAESYEKNLVPSLELGAEAWTEATAAQEEFDKKNASVKAGLQRLRNGVYEAAITLGEGFTPALGRAADKLSVFLKQDANRSALKKLGEDIGKSIDDIDWKEVLDGARSLVEVMKSALDWAKRLYDAFNLLPTPIKGAAAGFLAINQLSGGLIGGGLGNIFGGLGETLTKSLAARIPLFGRAFVQPVFVTNMGVGGLGGAAVPGGKGGMSAGAAVGALGVAGLIVAAAVPIGQAFAAALPASLKGEGGKGMSESQTRILQGLKEESAKTSKTPEKITALGVSFGRQSAEVKSAVERAKDAAMETKRETARGTGIVTSAVDRSAATIRNGFALIPPPMVSVNVAVSPTTINRVTNVTNRYGTTSGDRHSNSTGSGTLGNGGR
jgi:TP901 family phage tail tape measure protein